MEKTIETKVRDLCIQNPVNHVRKNHALEHATVHILEKKFPDKEFAGYSVERGFWIIGKLSIQEIQEAADAAFARLSHGEKDLAVHPGCGTNLATASLLTSVSAVLTFIGTKSEKDRLKRFSSLLLISSMAIQVSKPLGFAIQRNLTTDPDMNGMEISGIDTGQIREYPYFFIRTVYQKPCESSL
ncbi:MAG TPA: DUF6391 domain-containing protein [Flexilinea sp.]|nr:DUF6391 domain-containing protein [Flexilinea sp.]